MTTYEPIPKCSEQITRMKGDTDERSISERFKHLIESQAGKVAEELPKPQRVVDPKSLAKCRAYGKCQFCGKPRSKKARLAVAHIKSRAAGGGDEPENICLLCGVCHQNSHQTGTPSRDELLRLAQDRIRLQAIAPSAKAIERLVKEQGA